MPFVVRGALLGSGASLFGVTTVVRELSVEPSVQRRHQCGIAGLILYLM